jgi:hypothetical protein
MKIWMNLIRMVYKILKLGLDLKTGQVFLAKEVDVHTSSPALPMRAVRLWTQHVIMVWWWWWSSSNLLL